MQAFRLTSLIWFKQFGYPTVWNHWEDFNGLLIATNSATYVVEWRHHSVSICPVLLHLLPTTNLKWLSTVTWYKKHCAMNSTRVDEGGGVTHSVSTFIVHHHYRMTIIIRWYSIRNVYNGTHPITSGNMLHDHAHGSYTKAVFRSCFTVHSYTGPWAFTM